jgi:hypothetical protein
MLFKLQKSTLFPLSHWREKAPPSKAGLWRRTVGVRVGLEYTPSPLSLSIQQICIGLVVTRDGFPRGYEILAGNRTDVTTVKEIIEVMEGRYGKANPTFFSFLIRTASGNSFSKS